MADSAFSACTVKPVNRHFHYFVLPVPDKLLLCPRDVTQMQLDVPFYSVSKMNKSVKPGKQHLSFFARKSLYIMDSEPAAW